MPQQEGTATAPLGYKGKNAGETGGDRLSDTDAACRPGQQVPSGLDPRFPEHSEPPAVRLVLHDRQGLVQGPANGSAMARDGLSSSPFTASNHARVLDALEAGVPGPINTKQGTPSGLHREQRVPKAQNTPRREFKQAPAHDEHDEVAARAILSPKETYDHVVAAGVSKTRLTLAKQVTQGVLAGFYISFSFMLCMTVGGQIPAIKHDHPGLYNLILGSVGFPLGLTVIMVLGADLFTSSCSYMITAWIEGRVATYHVLRCWLISWWSNLAGCLIMAQLVVWAGLFAPPNNSFPIYLSVKKTSATFGATVVKGIFCNWLVNLAVWMANSARDLTGKAVGVYLPVSAFVTLGTEHVVANQFELSLAKMLGSGMSLRTIVGSNWVPATIGNIIGGAFFVGTLYAGMYGTLYERMWLRTTQIYIWAVPRGVRERISSVYDTLHKKLHDMVDWDAITAPPAPLPAPSEGAATAAAGAGAGSPVGRPSVGLARALTTVLAETPKKVATAVMAATRMQPMTPFERKRTSHSLGSDVV